MRSTLTIAPQAIAPRVGETLSIRGRVLDENGAPVGDVHVEAFSRRGFTLLEVLLVILITVLTMNLVGMALYQQLRIIEGTHGDVEQAQLARALLRNIGDDLRNVIKYAPMPVTLPSGGSAMAGAASKR